jgi:WD40 repeat protein
MSGPASSANPFVGPRPFEAGERLYGREREIGELHLRLNAERIVLLHSPSGAGKTSLVQAGLLPRLAGSFDVWGPTRVNTEPEISAGINRYTLSAIRGFDVQVPESLRQPAEALAGQTLSGYFGKRPRRRSAPPNTVLLFDQFEEILTIDPQAFDAKHEFFDQLGYLLRDTRVWALFMLREDYLAPLDPFARQVPTYLHNRFRIDLLGLDEARQAIVEPARQGGREFPAVDTLLQDLATIKVQQADGQFADEIGPHVEPVQLQVVCQRLWDSMPEGDLTIDADDLRRFGDVTETLAVYYAEAVTDVAAGDPAAERAIRDWFSDKLITAGGLRSQVLREAATSGGLANERIELLRKKHLVRAEKRAGTTWYELAHDRLIEPVRRDNDAWRETHLEEVQRRAPLWEEQGQPPGLLLQGAELATASQWEEENPALATETDRLFLVASRKQQELADRERRHVLRIRWLAFGTTLTTIIALVALVWAWRAYAAVREEARRSASRELALQSSQLLDEQLDLAVLLAQAAGRIAPTPEARRSLMTALQHNPRLWRFLPDGADAASRRVVAFAPDGTRLAVAGAAESIELWDVGASRPLPWSPLALDGAFEVRSVAFSPDGRWLAAGGKTADNNGLLGLWDVSVTPPRRYVTPEAGTVIRSLAFCSQGGSTRLAWNTKDEVSLWLLRGTEKPQRLQQGPRIARVAMTPDCAQLAVGAESDGGIQLWSFAGPAGKLVRRPLAGSSVHDLKVLAFDPAGGQLAAAGKESTVTLWDLSTTQPRSLKPGKRVRNLAFRPDGKTLAVAGAAGLQLMDPYADDAEDPVASLLAAAYTAGIDPSRLAGSQAKFEAFLATATKIASNLEPKKPPLLTGHNGPVYGIAFNPTGDVLVSIGEDGKLIVWRPDSPQRLDRQFAGADHAVWAVSFSPDGRSLVSAEGWDPSTELSEEEMTTTATASTTADAAEPEPAKEPNPPRENGSVRLWDLRTGEGTMLPGNPGPSRAVAFSPDGWSIAAGSRDKDGGTLHLWRKVGPGKVMEAGTWKASKPVNAIAFGPEGKSLLSAEGETLVQWNLAPQRSHKVLATHPGNLWSLLVRRSVASLLAGDETGEVVETDVVKGSRRLVLQPDPPVKQILAGLAESPDHRFIAAAGWKGGPPCVNLWRMPSGTFAGCLKGHEKPVSAVAFAHDGVLVSADDGGRVIFWNPTTRQEIGRLEHGHAISGLATSPDGRILAAAASDRAILLLDLDWDAAVRKLAGRSKLTHQECADWIHFEPKPAPCAKDER